MKNYLVTGGAGFIGSNFVHLALRDPRLEADDVRLVVVDKLTYAGNLDNLAAVSNHPRFALERVDIADRGAVQRLFRDYAPAAVINFAAESHVDRSIDDASAFIRTNIVGAFELLEAARHYWMGLQEDAKSAFRFLHVSTDEVYGSLGATGHFTEQTAYAPNSPYAASKASADLLVRAYHKTYGLPTLTTNCSNNYGPYQFPEKLIPLMILNAAEGKPLPIYGDGSNVRDWIHVEDHCRGVLAALADGEPGGKYNFGGSSERSNVEVVDALCAALEELQPAADNVHLQAAGLSEYTELKTFVTDRPGHDRRYAIDDSHARESLGWEPRHDFESGLRHTVRWYLEHDAWCRRVSTGDYRRERLGLASAADSPTAEANMAEARVAEGGQG
ncbi:MAG: dTDP-glucose 4,6-dehydratase [Acidobacteriota bacterium]|nr:dTDP-glucose 4,6-dehydratase [Acidobacteriota bacterium]